MNKLKHRGWTIDLGDYTHDKYIATSDNYDGAPDGDNRELVSANSLADIIIEIDHYLDFPRLVV